MWHVSGKGTDELWGVRATDSESPLPWVYQSPYAIIHAPDAEISFTKLEAGASACPTMPPSEPPLTGLVWDPGSHRWSGATGDLCLWKDLAYTVELNIGGKFVHGYNWQMSRVPAIVCQIADTAWVKEGWWRLTYHGVDPAVNLATVTELGAPVVPGAAPPATAAVEEAGDAGPLYAPVVDATNNLTYIDICIKPGKGGGGRPR